MPSSNHLHATAGFTVIELLVSMAIIAIMTSIVLWQYNSFNTSSLLTNQAYEIALDIRQAQVFALGERIDGANPRDEWGIQFREFYNKTYYLYRDLNDNNEFDDGTLPDDSVELIQESTLDNRFIVSSLKLCDVSCTDVGFGGNLDVLFRRPNYDAIFNSSHGSPGTAEEVSITIVPEDSPASESRTVTITRTGQITVTSP